MQFNFIKWLNFFITYINILRNKFLKDVQDIEALNLGAYGR